MLPFTDPAPRVRACQLTPTQAELMRKLDVVLDTAPVVGLVGTAGLGKSTLLQAQMDRRRGVLIDAGSLVEAAARVHPHAYADAFCDRVCNALSTHDFVAVDDLDYLLEVGAYSSAPRGGYTKLVVKQLCEMTARMRSKRLLLAGQPGERWNRPFLELLEARAAHVSCEPFSRADYATILSGILGPERAQGVDVGTVFRHASRLQGHQLRLVCELFAAQGGGGTEEFITLLDRHILVSNVQASEVEQISFDALPGAEQIAEVLERAIILPLENRALAQEIGLKPKRGVLLYGPPGTGKTVIGRALAHRMRGKFFLMDGSFISEPPGAFFEKLKAVVADAKANAPAVLFIDDADVLFKIEHIQGVVRFLLSLLDGLESETANEVCVMMTAMDVKLIPEAVLRSGRVEIWLETKLPDAGIRCQILRLYMMKDSVLPERDQIDYEALSAATEGFTQADLRRIVGDAKSLYAADRIHGRQLNSATEYLRQAIGQVIQLRTQMADSLGDEALRLPKPSKYFNRASATACGEECGR